MSFNLIKLMDVIIYFFKFLSSHFNKTHWLCSDRYVQIPEERLAPMIDKIEPHDVEIVPNRIVRPSLTFDNLSYLIKLMDVIIYVPNFH